jgi:hypothetical protein
MEIPGMLRAWKQRAEVEDSKAEMEAVKMREKSFGW